MGQKPPPTKVHCDNTSMVGIIKNTVKRQQSRLMEMRFSWISDQEQRDIYSVQWHPGKENLEDYQSKHHARIHDQNVRPWYLHT